MKKKLALLLALVMVCATMLTACGSKGASDISGSTWEVTKMESDQGDYDDEQLKALGVSMDFEFKEDGTLISPTGDEAKWEQDGNTVTVTDSNEETELKIDGDKMTMEQDGMKLEFTKK